MYEMMLKKLSNKMYKFYLLQTCLMMSLMSIAMSMHTPLMPNMENMGQLPFKGKPVSSCDACRKLVESFLKAVKETTRQSFAGGDADWERQKLGNYENSELRFIEIQEMLCADVGLGKDQCYNLAEEYEAELEDWFYEKRQKKVSLYKSLCINNLKVCCPRNTYGPKCIPCPGGIEKPCGGHGKCMKGGTREEPATCSCDAGYIGELCDACGKGYYQELDTTVLSCKICDKACKGHCRGPGPKNCEVCASGYSFVPEDGCVGDFDDYKNKVNIPSESGNAESETNTSDHSTSSDEVMSSEGEELNLQSNIEDSTVDASHSEL